MSQKTNQHSIGVIGLGYVGMPLAVTLAKHFKTTGFDISEKRVQELKDGWDCNREIKQAALRTTNCLFTYDTGDLKNCNIYVITVPTPVAPDNTPDLGPLESATKMVSKLLKKGDIVCYESTVYPGVTEDICGKILEENSGLTCGKDFYLGYSPERINPGDKEHTVQNITKVVSGQTEDVADTLMSIYTLVNDGKVFKAKNIKTAEASKAIENAQRDINVAFINEVTMILNKMGISSHDVLEAAKTKWNFLPFSPGLVGGHCISVDPYYLAQCAEKIGHEPEVILSGRKINDNMGHYIAEKIDRMLPESGEGKNILILGFTFKENINDIRNTKVIDVYNTLKEKGHNVSVHDPHAVAEEVKKEYDIEIISSFNTSDKYDAVALLVPHIRYAEMTQQMIEDKLSDHGIIFDMKGLWKEILFDKKFTYETL